MSTLENAIRLSHEGLENDTQKATVICTAAMFSNMAAQAQHQGNHALANACGYATTVLERMALGELPVFIAQHDTVLVQMFEEQVELTRKALREQGIDPITMQPIQPQTIDGEATEVVEPKQEN